MTVEVPGEDAVERIVQGRATTGASPRRSVALGACRDASASMRSLASSATTSPRRCRVRKPGAARDVERASCRKCFDRLDQLCELRLPPRPVALREAPSTEVPVVVLGRAGVVVLLHQPPRVRTCCRSRAFRTSARAATARRSTRIAVALAAHARLLDVHADPDHNRSVYTLVGDESELTEALLAAVRVAVERIDLRLHEGAHPRIGAADVVPIVPIRADDLARARATAVSVGARIGAELGPAGLPLRAARARACVLPSRRAGRLAASHRG